jgi:hypothetical protein
MFKYILWRHYIVHCFNYFYDVVRARTTSLLCTQLSRLVGGGKWICEDRTVLPHYGMFLWLTALRIGKTVIHWCSNGSKLHTDEERGHYKTFLLILQQEKKAKKGWLLPPWRGGWRSSWEQGGGRWPPNGTRSEGWLLQDLLIAWNTDQGV